MIWRTLWAVTGMLIARYIFRRRAVALDPVYRMRRAGL